MPNQNKNSSFSKKKLFLLSLLFAILLIIPVTVYLVQQRQLTTTQATPNTTLSFSPSEKTIQVEEKINFNLLVSPGNNQINFIKLAIKFDPDKLSVSPVDFTLDPSSNLTIQEGPTVENDTFLVALTIGADLTKVIQSDTKIGTLTFKAVEVSNPTTQISFDQTETQIRSISGGANDTINENVFLNGAPATVTILGGEEQTNSSTNLSSSLNSDESASEAAEPKIVTPESGEEFNDTTPIFEGIAEPNEIVQISIHSDADISEQVITDTNGNWTFTPTTPLSAGEHTITIVTRNAEGILRTITQSFVVYAATITPSNNSLVDPSDSVTVTGSTASVSANLSPLPPTGPTGKIVGFGILGGILILIGTLLFLAL